MCREASPQSPHSEGGRVGGSGATGVSKEEDIEVAAEDVRANEDDNGEEEEREDGDDVALASRLIASFMGTYWQMLQNCKGGEEEETFDARLTKVDVMVMFLYTERVSIMYIH